MKIEIEDGKPVIIVTVEKLHGRSLISIQSNTKKENTKSILLDALLAIDKESSVENSVSNEKNKMVNHSKLVEPLKKILNSGNN